MENLTHKKRIEFIDLAKGICILLVVMLHCGGPVKALPGFELVRMPLYFVLSGLFFKDYGGLKQLIVKKTNKLIIPFCFFYFIPLFLFITVFRLADVLWDKHTGFDKSFSDLFVNGNLFNVPIWFLLALFECNILFYFINQRFKSFIGKALVVSISAYIGYVLGNFTDRYFFYFDISMTALPFFCLGYYVKKTPLLFPNRFDKFNIPICLILWLLSFMAYMLFHPSLDFFSKDISSITSYLVAACSVFSMLFFCKILKRISGISYVGRYSIVILCTHFVIYKVFVILGELYFPLLIVNWYTTFILTLSCSIFCIPLCLKFIPSFIAQKDIIEIKSDYKLRIRGF